MPALPSIQTLRAFDAAARHGSYSAAADELGVTHGAVSHRIRELEERLNVRLFRRAGRLMVPTREAVSLLAQVQQALGALGRAFPERSRTAPEKLTVSVHPSLAHCWLLPNIGGFLGEFPDIDLEIRSTADLDDFLDPGIDIALRYGSGGWPNANDEKLASDVIFPVCAPEYRDRLAIVEPQDLSRCVLLRHAWQPWTSWFVQARLRLAEPAHGLSVSDGSMALDAAASGLGVALARGVFAKRDIESGMLMRLFVIEAEDIYGYFVAWRVGGRLSPAAEAFRDWVRRAMKHA